MTEPTSGFIMPPIYGSLASLREHKDALSPNRYRPTGSMPGYPVRIRASFSEGMSYSVVARELAKALYVRGIDVSIEPIDGIAANLDLRKLATSPPTRPYLLIDFEVGSKAKGQKNALYVPFEMCDSYRHKEPKYVKSSQEFAFLLTAGEFSRSMIAPAVRCKTVQIPLGVDAEVYADGPRQHYSGWFPCSSVYDWGKLPDQPIVFLAAGHLHRRKGIPELIHAYCQEFSPEDNVLLIVKGCMSHWGVNECHRIAQVLECYSEHPPIRWASSVATEAEMAVALRSADVFVSPHRMEGYGLMMLQALSCGTRVVATKFGGCTEFLGDHNAFLVETTGTAMEKDEYHDTPEEWCCYSTQEFGKAMRRAITESMPCSQVCDWDECAAAFIERAEEVGFRPAQRKKAVLKANEVAICVPVRNGGKRFERMLKSYRAVNPGKMSRMYLCDDASQDASRRTICDLAPQDALVVDHRSPHGTAASRNDLFCASTEEWIFSCDCDLEFIQEGWLAKMVEFAEKNATSVVAPLLLYSDQTHIWSAGGSFSEDGMPGRHRLYREHRSVRGAQVACEVPYAPGAAMLFHRSLLEKAGLWWDAYRPVFYEDADWCYAVRAIGGKILYCPDSVFVHNAHSYTSSVISNEEQRRLFARFWFPDNYRKMMDDSKAEAYRASSPTCGPRATSWRSAVTVIDTRTLTPLKGMVASKKGDTR